MSRNVAGERRSSVLSTITRAGRSGRTPVISPCQSVTLDQMNKVGIRWPEAHFDAGKMAGLAEAAHSLLKLDAVRVPFCQTIEAEALGCEIKNGGLEHVPGVVSHPASVGKEFSIPDDLLERGRLPVLVEAVEMLKRSVGEDVAIIGGVVGPFTLAGLLLGTKAMFIQTVKNPQVLVPIFEACLQTGIVVSRCLVEAGADIICVEDMAASAELISPAAYLGLVWPYQRRLFASLKVPSILHICGDISPTVEQMASTGATALSYEGKIHHRIVDTGVRDKVVLITGPDPAITLATETVGDVEKQCLDILGMGVDILAPGCAVATNTPSENILAMVSAAERFNACAGR